jgi:rubrerythrin
MKITNQQLINAFEELYSIEKGAHDYYEKLLLEKETAHEKDVIQGIHDDEERHMKIVKEILTIAESDK